MSGESVRDLIDTAKRLEARRVEVLGELRAAKRVTEVVSAVERLRAIEAAQRQHPVKPERPEKIYADRDRRRERERNANHHNADS